MDGSANKPVTDRFDEEALARMTEAARTTRAAWIEITMAMEQAEKLKIMAMERAEGYAMQVARISEHRDALATAYKVMTGADPRPEHDPGLEPDQPWPRNPNALINNLKF